MDGGTLCHVKRELRQAGLEFHGLEGDQFYMSCIKLGLDGRDEGIERFCRMLPTVPSSS